MLSLTKAFSLARSAAPHIAAVRPVPAALAPASSRIAFNQRYVSSCTRHRCHDRHRHPGTTKTALHSGRLLLPLFCQPQCPCRPRARHSLLCRQPGRRNLATLRAVREVSATEARELASSGAYQYLDVRTPEEFAAGHPPGAINIPFMFSAGGGMSPNPNFTKEVREQRDCCHTCSAFHAYWRSSFRIVAARASFWQLH